MESDLDVPMQGLGGAERGMLVGLVGNGIANVVCMGAGGRELGCELRGLGERCDEMGSFGGMGWSYCVVLRACKMDWICFDENEVLFLV